MLKGFPSLKTLLLATVFLGFAVSVSAQYNAGVGGTVKDPNGAVIVGAKITVTSQETGRTTEAVTNENGIYRVTVLPPGKYNVTADAANFKKKEVRGVAVTAEDIRGLDLTLELGTRTETITVTGESVPALQTENANLSHSISTEQIRNLPQNGRDPFELLQLSPGVFGDSSRNGAGLSTNLPSQQGPGGSNNQVFQVENQVQVVANGQRTSANNYQVDGVSINSLGWGGAAVISPNQESVKEVVVLTSSYSAEDGRNSGAQVKVISQNGTNGFHGSALVKFNDKGLNAFNKYRGPFGIPDRVNQKYRQFGGSIGGPILKDKLFFFFSYEGARSNNSTVNRNILVETPQFRTSIISLRPNSLAAKLFATPGIAPRSISVLNTTDCCSLNMPTGSYYDFMNATGGGPDGVPDFSRVNTSVPNTFAGDQFNGRLDYNRGKHQFFGSTYVTRRNDDQGGNRPIEDLTFKPLSWVLTGSWNWTISTTLLNEARANFTRWSFDQVASSVTTNFGIPRFNVFDFDVPGFGCCIVLGADRGGNTPGILAQNTFEFRDTLSKVYRTHAFKFGLEIRKEYNNSNESGGARPLFQFEKFLNFANDAPQFEAITVDPRTGGLPAGNRHFRTSDYGFFVQDDWKFRSNLTINLGLRYEYFTPLSEQNGLVSNYLFGPTGIVDGKVVAGKSLYDPDRKNFGPRLGFAWSPGYFGSKVVVRGGFGINYNRIYDNILDPVRFNTPFNADAGLCCASSTTPPASVNIQYVLGTSKSPFSYPVNPLLAFGVDPVTGGLCANAACTSDAPITVWGSLPGLRNAYIFNYSLGFEWAFAKHEFLSVGYRASSSHRLIRVVDLNRLNPGDTFDNTKDFKQNSGSNGLPCGPANPTCAAAHLTGNPSFQRIFFPFSDGNANYNALIVTYQHRFAYGFEVLANYAWSKTIDTASFEIGPQQTDPLNQRLDRGLSDFDAKHNFNLSAIWELPILRGRKDFVGKAFGGWSITGILRAHSGFPWTPIIFGPENNDPNGDGFRPDRVPTYNGGCISSPSTHDFINGVCPTTTTRPANLPDPNFGFLTDCSNVNSCLTVANRGVPGIGRNTFRGPGYRVVDLSFAKRFGLPRMPFVGEDSDLQFRADFYNAFNLLNLLPFTYPFGNVNPDNTFSFGRSPGGTAGRVIDFQLRFRF
jgi:outer membrane receptor protein involved in Fe transport